MEESKKNVKILVCYHKKDKLYKNEILVPIHCGRSIAFQKSKDGTLSQDEYEWLVNNTTGDNTGENISELNREVNEMTALYWAWKNYDKLGNPDYIGLAHYRRLFDFSSFTKFSLFKLYNLPLFLGLNSKTINQILKNYSFVSRGVKKFLPIYTDYKYDFYQNIINLSENYHPILYKQYNEFLKNKDFFCTNMFVMKKEDFFEMCKEIFPIMFDLLNKDIKDVSKQFLNNIKQKCDEKQYEEALKIYNNNEGTFPRIIGYAMERILSLYFMHLHEKYQDKALKNPIMFIKPHARLNLLLQNIFSIKNKNYNHKVLTILGIKISFKYQKTNVQYID